MSPPGHAAAPGRTEGGEQIELAGRIEIHGTPDVEPFSADSAQLTAGIHPATVETRPDQSSGTNDTDRDSPTRRLPGDHRVERALLGAALLADTAAAIVVTVDLDDWWLHDHRVGAEAIGKLFAAGITVDPLTVTDQMARAGHDHPTLADLHSWFVDTPSVSGASHYASIVRRHARHRRLVELAHDLSTAAMAGDDDRLENVARRIVSEIKATA